MKKFESTSIVCSRRHFPHYRRFFRFFSLKRKSEKGESKDKAADARHFPRRGKQGMRVEYKAAF